MFLLPINVTVAAVGLGCWGNKQVKVCLSIHSCTCPSDPVSALPGNYTVMLPTALNLQSSTYSFQKINPCRGGSTDHAAKVALHVSTLADADCVVRLLQGSKVFCLQSIAMQTIDVPQTTSMHCFLEQGDYEQAYKVACLGVTEADWKALGLAALKVGRI